MGADTGSNLGPPPLVEAVEAVRVEVAVAEWVRR